MEYGPAPEDDKPVRSWLTERQGRLGLFIGGQWRRPAGAEEIASVNPATGETLAHIVQARPEDVDDAVAAAREAAPGWAALPGHVRARYLYALARQVQKHARFLAVLETLDNGKPIRETRDIDIPLAARHFYHHAGWAQLFETEFAGFRPVGVVGQIIPWNFPLLMLAWKIAPALAAGNTVVLKPAELTSLTALAFAELCQEVGLPPGVVNIVTGDGRAGELIVDHPGIDKVAFTGSTAVGRIIRERTAGSGKRLSLELGGKSPFIVFDDADLDSAVEGVVDSIWFNQGQVCCAGSRLLVQESIEDAFIAKLKARMETLRVGDPLDKAVDIGAIVSPVQLARIEQLVQQGQQEGAALWQPSWSRPEKGYFYPPTLLTGVAPSATVAQEEIFGPVLVAMSFRTPAEAVALANNTVYGLAASIWTENVNLALDMAAKIEAGVVWINCTNVFDAAAGFGGYKESGFGREGGREGMWEYVKPAWDDLPQERASSPAKAAGEPAGTTPERAAGIPPIDRTPKMYIGGRQVRPDAPYSRHIAGAAGRPLGEVGEGNRKDIRNAVEAARKAAGWRTASGHQRAQVLYYVGENLAARRNEFAERLRAMTGCALEAALKEVDKAVERWFSYGAWADKYDGMVHHTLARHMTLAVPEPVGVIGIACPDDCPLLGFVSLVAPAVAMGNSVVAIPSERHPLAATDLYQVFDTSDVPPGVVNIVTGARDPLAQVLALHDGVDAVWYFGSREGSRMVEQASAGNMKRTWVNYGRNRDWFSRDQGEGREFLREATHIKNIWIPYGA
ncbi:MAG: aldehyde dehydrogenase family protein [Firmicutes bacterium]|nr:aldehyde dehydrogenase family protein [Bacillota bacterium]